MKSISSFGPLTLKKENSSINQTLQCNNDTKKLITLEKQSSEHIRSTRPRNDIEFKRTVRSSNSKENVELTYSAMNRKVLADIISDNNKIPVQDHNLPKELANVKSPEVFNAFVDSIYTKVSKFSNGEYKLEINVRGLGGARGTRNDRELRRQMIEEMVDEADRRGVDVVNNEESKSWVSKAWGYVKKNAGKILSGIATVSTIVLNVLQSVQHCNLI